MKKFFSTCLSLLQTAKNLTGLVIAMLFFIALSFIRGFAQCTPQGDPSVFGDHVWNVYAWNSGGLRDDGNTWNTNYSGYYVDTTLNFNSQSRWGNLGAPSDASGYLGCPVNIDYHSWSAKRTGFPCGYYQIDVTSHDDEGELFIDGVQVWLHDGCCDNHYGVWSGWLTDASSVEFRVTEAMGASLGSLSFTHPSPFSVSALELDCKNTSITLSTSASGTYLWSTGESTSFISASATGTYSVIVTGPGCSINHSFNVNASSPTSLTGPNCIGAGNLSASFSPTAAQVEWRRNDTVIQTNYPTYNLAAGTSVGSLSSPRGLFVDNLNNVYGSDANNGRVLKWSPGNPTPTVVAGGNGVGSAANQLNFPTGIYVDHDLNVYVMDNNNYRVQKWAPGATSGVTVAGGNGGGNAANQIGGGYGIAVDNAGNIYIADAGVSRVAKWAPGASSGATVAGGNGYGSALNQLASPVDVCLDDAGNVYIAEADNARITKWAPRATSGVVVAGGNGQGSNWNQLWYPEGVVVDHSGNIFVSNYAISNIFRWAPGATSGVYVTGGCCSGAGTYDNVDLAFGNDGTIYVCDYGNQRIVKYPLNPSSISPTFTPTKGGDYKLVAYSFDGCVSSSNPVTVHSLPTINLSGNLFYCTGGTTTLDAGIHDQYAWSDGATTQTHAIGTSGNYSIVCTDFGCSSTKNFTLVNQTPVLNVTANPSTICTGNSSQLTSTLTAGGLEPYTKTYYLDVSHLTNMPNFCGNNRWGYYYGGSTGFTFRDSGIGTATSIKVEFDITYEGNTNNNHNVFINNSLDGSFVVSQSVNCGGDNPAFFKSVTLSPNGYIVGGTNNFNLSNNFYFGLGPSAAINNYYVRVTVTYNKPIITYSWAPTGDTIASPLVTPSATTSYTVSANSLGCTSTYTTTVAVNPPPGDTAIFGNQVWNVYAFNSGGQSNTGHSWNEKYSGYYVDSSLNFITQAKWNTNGAPSDAVNYNGCTVANDNHSWSAKRKGFPCGTYQIDVPGHDDEAQLYINGLKVWGHDGCCDSHSNVWTGFLDNNSTVVFRTTEGGGFSYGSINFIRQGSVTPGGPTIFCPGYSVELTASTGDNYLWSTGETTQSITVNATGNYSVGITANGCTITFSQPVTVAVIDTPVIYSGTQFEYCPYNGANLYIQYNSRYQNVLWSNGSYYYAQYLSAPGDYSVTVSDALGCSATSHATIVSNVAGTDSSFGINAWKVNAYAQGYYNFTGYYYYNYSGGREWDTQDYSGYYLDSTLNFNSEARWSPSQNPSTAVGYAGCNVYPDIISWSAKRQGFPCGVYQIDVPTHDDNFQLWIDGKMVYEDPGCCVPKINAWTGALNDSSQVEFKVNDMGGASNGSLQFTLLDTIVNFVSVSGHPFVCTGQSYTLISTVQGNYLWSNGATVNPLNVTTSGSYTVTVTDAAGCSLTSAPVSITILPDEAPVAHITPSSNQICDWNTVSLTSDVAFGNLWSTGQTNQEISANRTDYGLKVTNSAGCTDSTSIHLNVGYTPPVPNADNNGPVCQNSSADLTASGLAPGGQVISLDGHNQSVEVFQDVPENDFTIELWVKTAASGGGIFSVVNDGTGGYDRNLYLFNGQLWIRVWNSSPWNSGFTINDGKWHHVALVVETGVGQIVYVDGISSGVGNTYDHSDFTDQTSFKIGYSADGYPSVFPGQIDNVRIWSEPRAEADIRSNMMLETPLSSANLVYMSALNGNLNAVVGGNGTAANGISYTTADYYTYTWTGAGAPPPSTSEAQTTSALSSGVSYTVTASAGSCSPSASASTAVDVTAATAYYTDTDSDTYGSSTAPALLTCNNPGTGYSTNNSDCNDGNPNVHPGATEVCNAIDDNCDGQVDEGVKNTFYADTDHDTYGNPGSSAQACSAPAGYVANNTDCNDGNPNVHPGATEICNSIDDNCNGQIDEGVKNTFYADADHDTYGNAGSSTQACSAPSGYVANSTDCNDNNGSVHPGAPDICNGVDDNCNGVVDENAIVATITPGGSATFCTGSSLTLSANSGSGILYQWMKNSKNISGATKQTYVATQTASYQVRESNSFSCNSTSSATSVTKASKPTATIIALGNLNICATGSVTLQANGGAGLTYQWQKGTANIVGATAQNYIATTKGTYKCIVTNSSACSNTSNSLKVTHSCHKDEEQNNPLSQPLLTIYPNPTNGKFIVDLKTDEAITGQVKIIVMNLLGQVVYAENGTLLNGEIQKEITFRASVSSGVYIVKVISDNHSYEGKIIYQQ